MTEEFPSNSKNPRVKREDRHPGVGESKEAKVEKVVVGQVVQRKKPMTRRFAETFGGSDSRGVLDYVIFDIAIPAAKDMFADVVTMGVERKLFGETRTASRRSSARSPVYGSPTAYHSMSRSGPREDPRDRERSMSRRARSAHDFGEILLDTRAEADEVIQRLYERIDAYDVATIQDLYDMVGITGSYVDTKWGWYELRGARPVRDRGGQYLLDLPRPEPID